MYLDHIALGDQVMATIVQPESCIGYDMQFQMIDRIVQTGDSTDLSAHAFHVQSSSIARQKSIFLDRNLQRPI